MNGTAEGGDQCLLNEFFGEWFYGAWDEPECGRLPMIMNVAAASLGGVRTVMRMQSRDEPAIAHFVGGEGKPWLFMVLKYQGQATRIPPALSRLSDAWDVSGRANQWTPSNWHLPSHRTLVHTPRQTLVSSVV